jgi:hypothetical protein
MTDPSAKVTCAGCGADLVGVDATGAKRTPCPTCGSMAQKHTLSATNGRFTNYTLDNFVAPHISKLTACKAPELSDDATWINSFILTTIFVVKLEAKKRAFVFNFIRRAHGATMAYRAMREHILEYISTPRNTVSPYFKALTQAEICIGQCYQGLELLATAIGENVFDQNSDSVAEKLHTVYIDSKHMDRMIAGSKLPDEATTGVWITNDGLASARGEISFVSLHKILLDLHGLAAKLSTFKPPEFPHVG